MVKQEIWQPAYHHQIKLGQQVVIPYPVTTKFKPINILAIGTQLPSLFLPIFQGIQLCTSVQYITLKDYKQNRDGDFICILHELFTCYDVITATLNQEPTSGTACQ